jgi:hypothetical protein
MPIQHQEGLLSMMERGEFTTTKVRNTESKGEYGNICNIK